MNHQAVTAAQIRRIVLEQSKRANVGHIGSSLSIADMISVLYGRILDIPEPRHPDRDRFVLSKGHAALAMFAAFYLRGWITEAELNTFHTDNSRLGVHPETVLPGVDFTTGSLGQGMSFAAGAALAARMQNSSRRVFVIASDAECNEGSLWEAVMFAAHHKLGNLTVMVDLNGQQALGYTPDVINLTPLAERWRAFGWDVHEVDGHNVDQMTNTINSLDLSSTGKPHVLICKTTFGKGVSYMESQIAWHYLPMKDDQYQQALEELERANA